MPYVIIDSQTYDRTSSAKRACDIVADSENDLPTENLDALGINAGSWAWCIAERTFKVLDGLGVWK